MTEGRDELRERIARVLLGQRVKLPRAAALKMADAVIDHLGLIRVRRSQNPPLHRWVTGWELD